MLSEMRWSRYDDSYESMKIVAEEEQFNLPYLYDGDTQAVTKAYGAVATPHVFIFDKERRLRYTGQARQRPPKSQDSRSKSEARDAIDALLAGKPFAVEKTRVFGCSTKWSEKDRLSPRRSRMERAAGNVAAIDADDVKPLVAGNRRHCGSSMFGRRRAVPA